MKKIILIALLFIGFNSYAQFDKGGVITLSNVSVFALDTSARNIIHIIEDERVAAGGAVFSNGEKQYVNYIVTNLKSIGVWYKCKAIYGFVGGTAASNKWNWKDMRDLDAAFRLTYTGGITHSNNGIKSDGAITSYANTFLTPLSVHTVSKGVSIICYIRTAASNAGLLYGANDNINNALFQFISGSNFFYGESLQTTSLITTLPSLSQYTSFSIKTNSDSYISNKDNVFTQSNTSGSGNNTYPNISTLIFGRKGRNSSGIISNDGNNNAEISFFADADFITQFENLKVSQIITYAQSMRANF
jgi:hypothetical protein